MEVHDLPRWMRHRADIEYNTHSSVVLALKTEADTTFLVTRVQNLAIGGNFAQAKRYADKPPAMQCSQCWEFGHTQTRCKKTERCRICGKDDHSEANHICTEYLILITEPWWGNIGNDIQGPVSETAAGWTPILPISSIKKEQRPRTMAYTQRRADFTVTLRADIANDLDIQVLEIVQAPHPPTILVNIYNDDKKQGQKSAAKRLQKLTLPTATPVVISGDWNLHHPLW
ncbi:hypothetical protein FOMPIDRAFT_48515, partial [Fomitopsis schrenkii]